MTDIPTAYDPSSVEDKWTNFWEENQIFASDVDPDREPYTIVIPPPNITGMLHMG
ncbi:MAG: class I tRNA ligase family protein, partial [Ignavibacteriales bacterium]|nr:class I tRNA ligase family protein [Ignavibacteriales bacterium]